MFEDAVGAVFVSANGLVVIGGGILEADNGADNDRARLVGYLSAHGSGANGLAEGCTGTQQHDRDYSHIYKFA